jgi:hypothetical protein
MLMVLDALPRRDREVTEDYDRATRREAELRGQTVMIPDEFRCPITCEVMTEPVICSDGHT